MTPVEAVSTAPFWMPSACATAARSAWTSSRPPGPASALALPEFARTARIPSAGTRGRASSTGAAVALLVVKTPAAAAGTSETTRATSRRCGFSPAAAPANRKPFGILTPSTSEQVEAERLVPAHGGVERLQRLAGGALNEIVDGRHGDRRSGARVGGDAQVH